jgi:hypothetical protein
MYRKRNPHMPFIIHVQVKLLLWPKELMVLSSHSAEFSEEDKAVFQMMRLLGLLCLVTAPQCECL